MEPADFIKDMAAVVRVLGPDEVPSKEHWDKLVEMLGEAMGTIVARKMMEESPEEIRRKAMEAARLTTWQQLSNQITCGGTAITNTYYPNPNINWGSLPTQIVPNFSLPIDNK